jgi:ATP-dependent Clp protease ATP-binding subunit ClpX
MPTDEPENNDRPSLCCSFCGKMENEVKVMVSGQDVYICDECTDLASAVVAQKLQDCSTK